MEGAVEYLVLHLFEFLELSVEVPHLLLNHIQDLKLLLLALPASLVDDLHVLDLGLDVVLDGGHPRNDVLAQLKRPQLEQVAVVHAAPCQYSRLCLPDLVVHVPLELQLHLLYRQREGLGGTGALVGRLWGRTAPTEDDFLLFGWGRRRRRFVFVILSSLFGDQLLA